MDPDTNQRDEAGRIKDELLAADSFEHCKDEMSALDVDELIPIKLDLFAAVATVLGVLPEVRALRGQIVKELPLFDLTRFDKLEDYALALSHAHARFLSTTQPPDDLDELVEAALELRETLLAEAKLLVQHDIVNEQRLAQLKGAKGYKNIAMDLMILANVLHEVWPRIAGKIFTTAQDLETAQRMSSRLLRIVGLREQAPAQVAEAMEQRVRAFTLLSIGYEDVRRAVAYLRAGYGDADAIAPSLYPGRPRSRRPPVDDEATPEAAAAPTVDTDLLARTSPPAVPVGNAQGPFIG